MTPTTDAAGERVERYARALCERQDSDPNEHLGLGLLRWQTYKPDAVAAITLADQEIAAALRDAPPSSGAPTLDVMAERLSHAYGRNGPSFAVGAIEYALTGQSPGPERDAAARAILARLATLPVAPDAEVEGTLRRALGASFEVGEHRIEGSSDEDEEWQRLDREADAAERALRAYIAALRTDNARLTAELATRPPVAPELRGLSEEIRDRLANAEATAARAGTKLIRMDFAITMIRHSSHGSAILEASRWLDGDRSGPVPWPGGALFEAWAQSQGWSNIDGFVGFRAIARLAESTTTDGAEG